MPEPLTVLLIVDNAPDAEDDMYVLPGGVHQEQGQAVWRGAEGRWIPLSENWAEQRRAVPPSLQEMLGPAPYFVPIVIRALLDGDEKGSPLGWILPGFPSS